MNAHELYVLEEKKRRWQIHLAQFGLFILFVGVWEGAVRAGWINDFIFSSPSRNCRNNISNDFGWKFISPYKKLL